MPCNAPYIALNIMNNSKLLQYIMVCNYYTFRNHDALKHGNQWKMQIHKICKYCNALYFCLNYLWKHNACIILHINTFVYIYIAFYIKTLSKVLVNFQNKWKLKLQGLFLPLSDEKKKIYKYLIQGLQRHLFLCSNWWFQDL